MLLAEYDTKCDHCAKEYKAFTCEFSCCFVDLQNKWMTGQLCKKCRKKLRKLIKEFLTK